MKRKLEMSHKFFGDVFKHINKQHNSVHEADVACKTELQHIHEDGIDILGDNKCTIFHAARFGYPLCMQLLIDHGADASIQDSIAIKYACDQNRIEPVQILIDNGVDVTTNNNIAIRSACKSNNSDIVQLLIDNGADVTANNNHAVRIAYNNEWWDVVDLLIDNGAILDLSAQMSIASNYIS